MEHRTDIFSGVLLRLLADHLVLSYQVAWTSWACGDDLTPAQRSVLRQDQRKLQDSINRIGRTFAKHGGDAPMDFGEISALSSVKPRSARLSRDPVADILASHAVLVEDICLAKVLVTLSRYPGCLALLTRLEDTHESTIAALKEASTKEVPN